MNRIHWTADDLGSLAGQSALVTGATGGLGLAVARALARTGARTYLAGRNPAKGEAALRAIRDAHPAADVQFVLIDLASLTSIRAACASFRDEVGKLDILVNNAGVMAPGARLTTQDDFELQFGTNHLGHFALTGLLLDTLGAGRGMVVNVASLAAWKSAMPFDDLNARKSYRPFARYGQSKLANLAFTLELDRRARLHGDHIHARAAHPGWSTSDIISNSAVLGRRPGAQPSFKQKIQKKAGETIFSLLGQDVTEGALPMLYALSSNALDGGYYGPQGRGERRGPPGPAPIPPPASDPALGRDLWVASEKLTGVHYDWGAAR